MNRSYADGKYQPPRLFPICTIHGHTAEGGARICRDLLSYSMAALRIRQSPWKAQEHCVEVHSYIDLCFVAEERLGYQVTICP